MEQFHSDGDATHPECDFPALKCTLNISSQRVARNFEALGMIGEENGTLIGSTALRISTWMVGYPVYRYFIVMAL
jgi:hypothetical protein